MMGGILVATVLTILVLPAGYALFFGKEPKKLAAEPVDAKEEHEPQEIYPASLAAE
jgi:multidrug efflux pump